MESLNDLDLKAQLSEIEDILSMDPNNEEVLALRQQLLEILALEEEVNGPELKGKTERPETLFLSPVQCIQHLATDSEDKTPVSDESDEDSEVVEYYSLPSENENDEDDSDSVVVVGQTEPKVFDIDLFDSDSDQIEVVKTKPTIPRLLAKRERERKQEVKNERKFEPGGSIDPTAPPPTREYDGYGRSENRLMELPKQDLTGRQPTATVVTQGSIWLDRSDRIADWEKYTTGFGSRMLAKYGYVKGTGLGPSKIGIKTPLMISNKAGNTTVGLGHRAREKAASQMKEGRRGASKRKRESRDEVEDKTMFDNMNERLNKKARITKSLRGLGTTELEEIVKAKREILERLSQSRLKYEIAMERNRIRDPASANILAKKLDAIVKEIKVLEQEIASAQSLLDVKSYPKKTKLQNIF